MSALLDTDILIDHLRGLETARELLLHLSDEGPGPAVSVITVAEVEAGVREPERERVDRLFSALVVLDVDRRIAKQAGRYRASFGASHGVLLPDALIAATAKTHRMDLFTLNDKHYPMDDIRVRVPYQKG